ncbi:MAG: 4Fe-4S dicluster domain-containing protein [Promethearchaeia archaeon]
MNELEERISEISGVNVDACYQCGKCSAGCLFTAHMDLLPHQVLMYIQRGDESVLDKETPWICASCFTCSVRCPCGVDVAAVMESLREIRIRERGYETIDLRKVENLKDLPQIALTAAAQKLTW